MSNEPYPRTTINISGELAEALDSALEFERNRGNKYLETRSQLAKKILWETLREDYPLITQPETEDTKNDTQS